MPFGNKFSLTPVPVINVGLISGGEQGDPVPVNEVFGLTTQSYAHLPGRNNTADTITLISSAYSSTVIKHLMKMRTCNENVE